jgi:hypothetical protein
LCLPFKPLSISFTFFFGWTNSNFIVVIKRKRNAILHMFLCFFLYIMLDNFTSCVKSYRCIFLWFYIYTYLILHMTKQMCTPNVIHLNLQCIYFLYVLIQVPNVYIKNHIHIQHRIGLSAPKPKMCSEIYLKLCKSWVLGLRRSTMISRFQD